MQPDVVKGYEGWYEGKYKRADNLEKLVLSKMIDEFDHPKTILEVGSGTSHFTRWLSSQGFAATGADLSPFMVRQAKTLWPSGDLLNARSSNLPFASDSFDLAIFVPNFSASRSEISILSPYGEHHTSPDNSRVQTIEVSCVPSDYCYSQLLTFATQRVPVLFEI